MFKHIIKVIVALIISFQIVSATANITDKTLPQLQELADKNDAEALNELGNIYSKGLNGVVVDRQKGFDFLLRAANLNHAEAQFHVALLYDIGFLGKKDAQKAAIYYKKSADNGFVSGLYSLGEMYLNGDGVPKDTEQGLSYWKQASDKGLAAAQHALGVYFSQHNNPKEALYYTELAVKQNHPQAQYNLAIFYLKGFGVEKNKKEAIKLLRLACAQETSLLFVIN